MPCEVEKHIAGSSDSRVAPVQGIQLTESLVVYVSGHGFGHAVRTGLVIEQLQARFALLRIVVRTTAPAWLFPPGIDYRSGPTDVGVLQADSLSPLVEETLTRAMKFERERPRLAHEEAAALRDLHPRAIVADIPPLAFDVARELDVPSIAIGNFSWDWIYATLGGPTKDLHELTGSLRSSEATATLLLRLPFHGDMSAFPRVEDIPLIARISGANRAETRERLGIPNARPAVLLSFGGFELDRFDLSQLANLPKFVFVTTMPLRPDLPENVIVCPRERGGYADLLAACDVVVMKPGYGTVVDCLAHQVPMVYTTRPGFMEEEILVEAMQQLAPAAFISQADLLAARLGPSIEAALTSRQPWRAVRLDGAAVAGTRILEIAGLLPGDQVQHRDLRWQRNRKG